MRKLWLRSAAISLVLALPACGGGGGGINSTPAPTPAPTPTPTPPAIGTPTPSVTPAPTPTPTPMPSTGNDTAEYRATVGAVSMNALAAYNAGATGKGVGIGIVDSGIDLQSGEFDTRISSASASVAGNASIDDEGGHGTAVAFTAAGHRNGVGTQGVAPEATLVVLRADTPGSCATDSASKPGAGCQFDTGAIARGIDTARVAGARVVNLSLGGSAMPANLVAAVSRATAAGIIVVIAAGNDGGAQPDPFANVANDTANARNLVIIAGAVNANNNRTAGGDTLATFSEGGSNMAGASAAHYLAAVGSQVRAPDENNTAYLWSGTSFAAPQIAGAIALLAQAFPNLSGAQIVDLLYRTARDAGAAGIDSTYGNGVLDLTRAFQPVGTTTAADTRIDLSQGVTAALSAPMGDAAMGALGTVVLDGYGRAFAAEIAQTAQRARLALPLTGALDNSVRSFAMARGGTTVSMTLGARHDGSVSLAPTNLSLRDARAAQAIAGTVTQRIGPRLSFGIGFSTDATTLTAELTGQREPAFLIARADTLGFDATARGGSALRRDIGRWGLTVATDRGQVINARQIPTRADGYWQRSGYRRHQVTIDRRIGPVSLIAGATRLREAQTVLGARFGGVLGAPDATSWFADGVVRLDAGSGWSVGGRWRQGWTRVAGGATRSSGSIRTDAFAADIGKLGVFGGDSAGLRIAQPLRVTGGGLDVRLPTYWDYATGSITEWAPQRLNLAPTGHELDVEARYGRAWLGGDLQTNLFWRRDPGNIAALAPDLGMAVRYSRGF